jgi:hypothetical protein
VNNGEPLEIESFYLCHIYLGVGKLHVLPNIKCKTVGVALSRGEGAGKQVTQQTNKQRLKKRRRMAICMTA